ncbi:MAG TPA: rhodanese-like domain-containing protein [Methylotenera sp.]|mgnify:CR=1 FL=1|nr:rhodanese-like domain-containing protein [Methylotenera sp.]HPH06599.1 rhodanese-like domain-containing protein [Methylotenera sp.]HPN01843.1 rhodanese-like domain-containing protein [Methylotenera sp.]
MHLYHEISADDLLNLMAQAPFLLIDVRDESALADGMIAGASHVPLAFIPVQYQSFNAVGNIIFYCQRGVRSAHAAAYVASKGIQNVFTLVGGINAWQDAGQALAYISEERKHAI